MKFVYGAHLDDSLIVLGASVFFILVPYFGAPEKFSLEVSISVVVLYVLLSLWLWLLWWLWLLGFGCMAAWSWLHGCGCLARSCMLIFSTSQKKHRDMAGDQAAWLWLLGALHGCGCLAGDWRLWLWQ
jgi:hypothetical protein